VDPFAEGVNVMNAVAMDRDGNVSAVFQTLDMSEPEENQRSCVPLKDAD